jgi:hypothetical protein
LRAETREFRRSIIDLYQERLQGGALGADFKLMTKESNQAAAHVLENKRRWEEFKLEVERAARQAVMAKGTVTRKDVTEILGWGRGATAVMRLHRELLRFKLNWRQIKAGALAAEVSAL